MIFNIAKRTSMLLEKTQNIFNYSLYFKNYYGKYVCFMMFEIKTNFIFLNLIEYTSLFR